MNPHARVRSLPPEGALSGFGRPGATEMAAPVLISLSSFGAAEVRRHGQLWFARLAAEAGADGIEVRGELLADADAELPAIADALPDHERVFSSPEPLWSDDGRFDAGALDRGLAAAGALRAKRLKMSIGNGSGASAAELREMRDRLAATLVELLIENDQTAAAGTLAALQRFFGAAQAQGLALGMTFDVGNWHWTGECPREAAAAFAPIVRYVHCKGVARRPRGWAAVPLAASAAPWRSVLRALPADQPRAIEFPLQGDDLLALTREQLALVRSAETAQ